MTTLPSHTKTIDDSFLSTWYEIRADATDNILTANVIWAALKMKGCFTPQVGGQDITRTIRYGVGAAEAIKKGSILPDGEVEYETAARWNWKYIATHVQRSLMDDQKNSGKMKIKSLINTKLTGAREALADEYETDVAYHTKYVTGAATVQVETGATANSRDDYIQSIFDAIPAYTVTSGTYGNLTWSSSNNSWWRPTRTALTTPVEVNLLANMRTMFNTISNNNRDNPDLILTTQTYYELYEDFALEQSQIIKDVGSQLADLGFGVLRFKGQPLTWTSGVYNTLDTSEQMVFLNTKYIEVVYDPNLWFDMTHWKDIPLQTERIAHIICAANVICTQRRRQGILYTA